MYSTGCLFISPFDASKLLKNLGGKSYADNIRLSSHFNPSMYLRRQADGATELR